MTSSGVGIVEQKDITGVNFISEKRADGFRCEWKRADMDRHVLGLRDEST